MTGAGSVWTGGARATDSFAGSGTAGFGATDCGLGGKFGAGAAGAVGCG